MLSGVHRKLSWGKSRLCLRIVVLRSEIPSGMCAKLRIVVASNNRDHARNPSYYCFLALHISWCYSSQTSRSWRITQSTQHHRRVCNNIPSFLQRTTPIARSLCEGLNSERPPHPGHSTILLRSKIPSGMYAKLRTMEASNNRDHARKLSYYCLLALHILWCYSSRTSHSCWITQSTQHYRRGCNSRHSGIKQTRCAVFYVLNKLIGIKHLFFPLLILPNSSLEQISSQGFKIPPLVSQVAPVWEPLV